MLDKVNYTTQEILEARHILWRMGIVYWKLDITQKKVYDFIHENKEKIIVIAMTRRGGKSFLLCTLAIEACLKNPNTIVKYVAPTQTQLKQFIKPLIRDIVWDCPSDIIPIFNTHDNAYKFANGSEIQLAGTDNGNYERLRGGNAHLCIIDEAGFCSDLEYVIRSVLLPTMLITKGKLILSSTPPASEDHDYMRYWKWAEERGSFIKKTIDDVLEDRKIESDGRLTPEIVEEMANSYPDGRDSVEFQREYLCKLIIDQNLAIIPEFTEEIQRDTIVNWPRPPHFDCYVSMDIGFKDLTMVLFAYYDFKNNVIVIEDELSMSGPQMTTDVLAEMIKRKEVELWKNELTNEIKTPHLRIADNNNLIVLNDLYRLHGLMFLPTTKDEKHAMINQLRMKIAARQIIINPKCKKLISHLKNGLWKKGKTEFARNSDGSHYDGIDALAYLIRNIDFTRNPYPRGFEYHGIKDLFYKPNYNKDNHNSWKSLFIKKKDNFNK